jgi:hypothetical protein
MNRLRFQPARFALLLIPLLCFGRSPKLASDLDNVDPQSTVDVIVQFATPADNEQHQKINQVGGLLRADLELIQGAVYSIPAAALTGLANNHNVLYISPDRQVTATLDYADPTLGAPTALLNGWDGTGVGIAIIDSGIQGARDLLDQTNPSSNVSRIVYSESFVPRSPALQTSMATARTWRASWPAMEPPPPALIISLKCCGKTAAILKKY